MFKLYYKFKKNLNIKGFTLVELLAVIVVLAIIMLIGIPAILDVMHSARRKSFVTYVDRIGGLSSQKFMKDNIEGKSSGCYIYNIKDDFDLSNTGSFKGYVLVNSNSTEIKYYITLWNDDYMLVAYNYTDGINYKGQKKIIDESLEKYDSTRNEDIKPGTLCNYACNICTYEGASNDPYDNSGDTSLEGDISKIKGATTLIKGEDFKNKIINVAGNLDNVYQFKRVTELRDDVTKELVSGNDESSIENPVYIWYEDNTIYFYSDATKIFLNPNSSWMFSNLKNTTDLSGITKEVEANKVTTLRDIFNSSGITKIDLSNWNTPELQIMSGMFYNTVNLKEINLKGLDTSKVTKMDYMFNNSGIEYIDLSMLDTSNLKRIDLMFYLSKIIEVNMSNWETPNLTDIVYAFRHCNKLKKLYLNKMNVSKVKNFSGVFQNCSNLEELNIDNWNPSSGINFEDLFINCSSLKIIDVSNWDVSKATTFGGMFNGCKKLQSLNMSNWNTLNVTNMSNMFAYCESLKNLDVKNFNTSKVTSMYCMFDNNRNLDYLDLSTWDTSKVRNMYRMFYWCTGLKTLDLSNWDTSSVTNMLHIFLYCSNLEHIYVKNSWSTIGLESPQWIFENNIKLHNYNNLKKSSEQTYIGEGGYFEEKPII